MKTVKCPVCGEVALALRKGPNRFVTHRRMAVEVPHDFELPECAHCGARPINLKLAEKLDPLLQAAYEARLAQLVNADLDRLSQTRPLYEWEQILGYSKGWLSKIREARAPSPQAVALVRLMANAPDREKELKELWASRPTTHVLAGVSHAVSEKRISEPPRADFVVLRDFSVQTAPVSVSLLPGHWHASTRVSAATVTNERDDAPDLGLAA